MLYLECAYSCTHACSFCTMFSQRTVQRLPLVTSFISRDISDESSESCEDEMSEPYCTSDEEEQEDPKDYHKGS